MGGVYSFGPGKSGYSWGIFPLKGWLLAQATFASFLRID